MVKVSDLSGAALDFWVARAEGIAHADIFWRKGGDFWTWGHDYGYSPSTDWARGGPLIEKHHLNISETDPPGWVAWSNDLDMDYGDTPLQAICRAVVRAAFGDEVEEVLP